METFIDITEQEAALQQESRSSRLGQRIAVGSMLAALSVTALLSPSAEASVERSDDMITVTNPNTVSTAEADPEDEIVIYSFNALGSQMPNGGNPRARARAGADILLGKTDAPRADILGLQEIQKDQKRFYMDFMPGYAAFPKEGDPQNLIMVNTKKFDVLHTGTYKYSSYGDKNLSNGTLAVWVHVRDKATGKTMTLMNSRFPAWNEDAGSDYGGAQKREHDTLIERRLAHGLDERFPNSTQFIIGDKNATYKIRLKPTPKGPRPNRDLYCFKKKQAEKNPADHEPCLPWEILESNPYFMSSSFDMVQNTLYHEPTKIESLHDEVVDWVFLEPSAKNGVENIVKSWQLIKNNKARISSDHFPLAVTVDLGQKIAQ